MLKKTTLAIYDNHPPSVFRGQPPTADPVYSSWKPLYCVSYPVTKAGWERVLSKHRAHSGLHASPREPQHNRNDCHFNCTRKRSQTRKMGWNSHKKVSPSIKFQVHIWFLKTVALLLKCVSRFGLGILGIHPTPSPRGLWKSHQLERG